MSRERDFRGSGGGAEDVGKTLTSFNIGWERVMAVAVVMTLAAWGSHIQRMVFPQLATIGGWNTGRRRSDWQAGGHVVVQYVKQHRLSGFLGHGCLQRAPCCLAKVSSWHSPHRQVCNRGLTNAPFTMENELPSWLRPFFEQVRKEGKYRIDLIKR